MQFSNQIASQGQDHGCKNIQYSLIGDLDQARLQGMTGTSCYCSARCSAPLLQLLHNKIVTVKDLYFS